MDALAFIVCVLLALMIVGSICYPLGWRGTLAWLAVCSIALLMVQDANQGGGCDGGLCILPYVLVWPPICLVAYLVLLLAIPKKYRSWFGESIR